MIGRSLIISIYRTLTALLEPAAAGLLLWRQRRGKEDPARIAERRGYPGVDRPEKTLVWLHGASVGETVTLLPLVERLQRRGLAVLVTSGTVTSARLLEQRLPAGAIHQYLPLDVPRYMRRFLDYWRPDLGLLCESEIWPNLMIEAGKRGIPLVQVNARMSERSFQRWYRFPKTSRYLLSGFERCLAQSQEDGQRLAQLGAPRVSIAGNLKFDVPAPPADPNTLALLDGLMAGRPVWVAASTHPGEEEDVLAAHLGVKAHLPKLLTIVAPRHPDRGDEVAALAQANGAVSARRSLGQLPEREVEFYVADTLGDLGLFYRLAPVAFIGGSLAPIGGHNPIEPAKLGCALLHGPLVHKSADLFAAFDAGGGARQVADRQELAGAVHRWLSDPAAARQAARAAAQTSAQLGGALERTVQALEPLLMRVALGQRETAP
ncbi:3-deoxy-D-manno-octulosonic acid transferase [Bosea sp. (in: a-proteobacteria)]|jgi:3-deoxy-D-manno-octulosonic-acid transferase|uniref:3-deoxy-D-manno-octulosonic acid transferase n=1 Tax=Bosea sp. (in: a-proteobacteria) TaxID=1871050 RepID=UPI00086EDBC5|nr:3-deoxy-D-manno-octulosonic acid transferase [Bosea sp. (in: a-proteobacteria)]MBN9440217.1 3-deoxy-D-manno-octulosonic acid transferase [Bosea sp. (in: a-proteobacteria)]ODT46868.1 MAG: 3-deoxy-D-manno-octulosonic acid transferase [Methylobacterium sp. SCN 67-24]